MIQAIVYDAVGTLIHVKHSVAGIYAEFGRRFGSRLDGGEVRRRFQIAFARQDRLDEDAGWRTDEARERARWRDIVMEVLDDIADPAGCFESLFAEFSKPEVWSYDPDAIEVLAAMERRGYRQAMASNFDRRLHGVIAGMPPMRHLERVIVSSEVGWRKPAPEFFAALAVTLGLSASDILFVGDDRGNDYEAARRAGMRALLLDPHQRHPDVRTNRLERLSALIAAI
jgi:putative hydrolase of the HAD superfamily